MEKLDELLEECGRLHGHLCAGQVLGVRMALTGCELIGVAEPRGAGRKKLIVWVEIDRCMTDAVSAVTGARLGRRTLKYLDYGKVAASFLNTQTGEAVRVAARDDSRRLADERYPRVESKKERQMHAYREARDEELFKIERVSISLGEADMPGHPKSRVRCARCGEGVNDARQVVTPDGEQLCRACAHGSYYELLDVLEP